MSFNHLSCPLLERKYTYVVLNKQKKTAGNFFAVKQQKRIFPCTCICCRSNQTLGQFVLTQVNLFSTQVNLFLPRSICFNLQVNLIFFFCFCSKQKKELKALSIFSSSSFSSSPLYLPHLLFPPLSPSIPAPILFISMLTLRALNRRPLGFPWIHVLMPYQ